MVRVLRQRARSRRRSAFRSPATAPRISRRPTSSTPPAAPVRRGIVDAFDNPKVEADLAVYRATWGLPPCTTANGCFRKVNQRGGATPPLADAGWGVEIALDVQAVSAACPNCQILLVEADDPSLTTSASP